MKTLRLVMLVLVLTMFAGCAGMGKPAGPVDIRAQTPNLNVDPAKKLQLKLAVVVPEPMNYTIMYYGAWYIEGKQSGYSRDSTAGFREAGFFLEREIAKVASETFSQAFSQVVVLRELPPPGQFDAIVQFNISKIGMFERVNITGESCDVTTEWSMSVLDEQNREIFARKGVTPVQNFTWSVLTPDSDFLNAMGPIMSKTVTDLAKEWGTMLYASKELRTHSFKP